MRFALVVFVVLSVGCGGTTVEPPGCLEEEPGGLGRQCSGDGECGDWLVCREGACALPPAVSGDDGTPLEIVEDGQALAELQVEIARGDLQRERGLGYRPCIEDGWGMLIEFQSAEDHLLETDTMRFDLDIAMAGDDRVIHTLHLDAPAGGKALYGSREPTRYVLEVPAKTVDLRQGARLSF